MLKKSEKGKEKNTKCSNAPMVHKKFKLFINLWRKKSLMMEVSNEFEFVYLQFGNN